MNDLTPLGQIDQANQDIAVLLHDLAVGDDLAGEYASAIRHLVGEATATTRAQIAKAAELHADKWHNPAGVAEELATIPRTLASLGEKFDAADQSVSALARRYRTAALTHNAANDGALRWEVDNFLTGKSGDEAWAVLLTLVTDTRYATFLGGSAGRSLAARFGRDPGKLEAQALETLAASGNTAQQARLEGLARIPAVVKAIGRARKAASLAAEEVQRPPRPASGAPR